MQSQPAITGAPAARTVVITSLESRDKKRGFKVTDERINKSEPLELNLTSKRYKKDTSWMTNSAATWAEC